MSRAPWPLVLVVVVWFARAGHAEQDIAATLEAYCAHRVECVGPALTVQACLADQPDVAKAAGVDDAGCADFVELLLAHYQCQTTLACEALLDPAQQGCPTTAVPLLDQLLTHGVSACFDGRPPVDPPDGWTCAAHYYNGGSGDGCDCGCGVIDRDCEIAGVVGCGEGGCSADGCDYCYLDGDNVACDDAKPTPPSQKPPAANVDDPSCAAGGSAGLGALLVVLARRRRAARATHRC